jgi:hypothetical protein
MGTYERHRLREILTRDIQKEFPYPLLSDPDRVLIAALGAGDAGSGKTKRGHFIFEKGGKLVEKKLPVSPGDRYVIINSNQSWHQVQRCADMVITYEVLRLPLNLSSR